MRVRNEMATARGNKGKSQKGPFQINPELEPRVAVARRGADEAVPQPGPSWPSTFAVTCVAGATAVDRAVGALEKAFGLTV